MNFSHQPSLPRPRLGIAIACLAALAAMLTVFVATAGAPAASASGGLAAGTPAAGTSSKPGKTAPRYVRLWNRTSQRNRRWAHRTARCESGRNPRAIGGGGRYRGAFQFLRSTWRTSPKSPGGDPIRFSYKTQAVVAVKLKQRAGTNPWPVCG